MTMDDPSTDLYHDPTKQAIVVAGSYSSAHDLLKSYGIDIQSPATIHIVVNSADALAAVASYSHTMPWCIVNDGLFDARVVQILKANFGVQKSIHEALGVENRGVARVPGRYPWDRPA